MNKRFIVLILDGFGIGAMDDAKMSRAGDEKANTLRSILEVFPHMKLPHLEKLGLMNAYGNESANMKHAPSAIWGKCRLLHAGADTYMGHQEIMGSYPMPVHKQPFHEVLPDVLDALQEQGYDVKIGGISPLRYLLVNHYVIVADNIDAEPGNAYNCTAPLDCIPFDQVVSIAKIVRRVTRVNRIIPFGGTMTSLQDLLDAQEIKENRYIGINAVKSKSYRHGLQVLHLGYGVEETTQVPWCLHQKNVPVTLLGKVADIIENPAGKRISCVDTQEVLQLTLESIKQTEHGFICTNVQETDLAGHSQDAVRYYQLLCLIDDYVGQILSCLLPDDILLICADHGNDPGIRHNQHTREQVPLLLASERSMAVNLRSRSTLSDIGATVCEFFEAPMCQNGESFLKEVLKI